MEPANRKGLFAWGIVLAFLPYVLWFELPVALFTRLAALLHMDKPLLFAVCFTPCMISEAAAWWLLDRSRLKPVDALSIVAMVLAIFSGVSIAVFLGAIIAVAMAGS